MLDCKSKLELPIRPGNEEGKLNLTVTSSTTSTVIGSPPTRRYPYGFSLMFVFIIKSSYQNSTSLAVKGSPFDHL